MSDTLASDKLHALEFTLQLGCILNCRFCPQETLLKNFKLKGSGINRLSFENFKKCLLKVEKGGTVTFSGMAEPFLNRECAKMIRYAYEEGYTVVLFTTLIGMTFQDYELIKDVKFDKFILHIPDEEGNSKFVISKNYIQLLEKVVNNIDIEYYSCHGRVHHEVIDILPKNVSDDFKPMDRAGNLKLEKYNSNHPKGGITCLVGSGTEKGRWSPEMLPDGTLILCCMDYSMKHVLGNLINQSWNEIKDGNEYKKYIAGLKDDTIDILCRKCSEACEESNLDAMKLKAALEELKSNQNQVTFKSLGGKVGNNTLNIMNKIIAAKNICIFGLGKLFKDKYFVQSWNRAIHATVFSDNDSQIWNTEINGIKCVDPEQLTRYKDLLVITHIKNDLEVNRQLDKMGICNHINIYDIYRILN